MVPSGRRRWSDHWKGICSYGLVPANTGRAGFQVSKSRKCTGNGSFAQRLCRSLVDPQLPGADRVKHPHDARPQVARPQKAYQPGILDSVGAQLAQIADSGGLEMGYRLRGPTQLTHWVLGTTRTAITFVVVAVTAGVAEVRLRGFVGGQPGGDVAKPGGQGGGDVAARGVGHVLGDEEVLGSIRVAPMMDVAAIDVHQVGPAHRKTGRLKHIQLDGHVGYVFGGIDLGARLDLGELQGAVSQPPEDVHPHQDALVFERRLIDDVPPGGQGLPGLPQRPRYVEVVRTDQETTGIVLASQFADPCTAIEKGLSAGVLRAERGEPGGVGAKVAQPGTA